MLYNFSHLCSMNRQWWNLQAYQNTSECLVNTFLQAHSWFALNKHLSKSSLWILNKLLSNASQHISLRWNTNWCQIHPQNTQVNPKQSVWDFKQENWHRYWKAHVLYLQADVSMTARTTVRINIITIIMIPDKMRTPRVFLHRRQIYYYYFLLTSEKPVTTVFIVLDC